MKRGEKIAVLVILLILIGLWLVFLPGCPWRNLTGIPCPGCGMSRAWMAAFRMDFGAAFAYHPMFWCVPVFGWLFWRDFRPFQRRWLNIALLFALSVGIGICYGYRMYFHLIN